MSEDKRSLFREDKCGATRAADVLTRIFRLILHDYKITPGRWQALVNQYLNDPRNGVPSTGADRSSHRGNLNKELLKPTMTIKVFQKAMRFLRPSSIRFEVHLGFDQGHPVFPDGKQISRGVNLSVDPPVSDEYDVIVPSGDRPTPNRPGQSPDDHNEDV